jgi:hypothetical protein
MCALWQLESCNTNILYIVDGIGWFKHLQLLPQLQPPTSEVIMANLGNSSWVEAKVRTPKLRHQEGLLSPTYKCQLCWGWVGDVWTTLMFSFCALHNLYIWCQSRCHTLLARFDPMAVLWSSKSQVTARLWLVNDWHNTVTYSASWNPCRVSESGRSHRHI